MKPHQSRLQREKEAWARQVRPNPAMVSPTADQALVTTPGTALRSHVGVSCRKQSSCRASGWCCVLSGQLSPTASAHSACQMRLTMANWGHPAPSSHDC